MRRGAHARSMTVPPGFWIFVAVSVAAFLGLVVLLAA